MVDTVEEKSLEECILRKTQEEPKPGVDRASKEIEKYDENKGPVSEYLDRKGPSEIYDEFEKDRDWMNEHVGHVARFLKKEFGFEQIELKGYIIEIPKKYHKCYKLESKYCNTALDYHEHGVNGAFYSIYPIRPEEHTGETSAEDIIHKQEGICRGIFNDILNSMPPEQMRYITQVQPHFITKYTIDSEPYLCVQMEVDLPAVIDSGKGVGVYGDLFLTQSGDFPFFPFQPIFAGKDNESALIIIPRIRTFDVDKFRESIADRLGTGKDKVRFKSVYNLKVDIEQLEWSVGPHVAHNIRIKYRNPKEINVDIAETFLRMSENDIRIIQGAGGALKMKGRKSQEISEGLLYRILDWYGNVTGESLYTSIFGTPKQRIPIDSSLAIAINKEFQKEKKRKLLELE